MRKLLLFYIVFSRVRYILNILFFMKKEKKTKENKKLKSAMTAYFDVSASIGLTDEMSVQEKLQKMLSAGVYEMSLMHEKLDDILKDDWDNVYNVLGIPISKAQYKEFVNIMTKIKMDKFSDKNRAKYEYDTKQKMFDQCAREKFLDTVINSYEENVILPEQATDIEVETPEEADSEFNEIFDRSIEKNIDAICIHKKMINNLGLAFEYVTQMKYTKKDFKMMLDFKYYNGGVPNENSHAKLFDLFYKFMTAYRIGLEFELPDFEDYASEMGLQIDLSEPMPRSEHWEWWTPDVIEKYCPTIKEEYFEWLKEQKEERQN